MTISSTLAITTSLPTPVIWWSLCGLRLCFLCVTLRWTRISGYVWRNVIQTARQKFSSQASNEMMWHHQCTELPTREQEVRGGYGSPAGSQQWHKTYKYTVDRPAAGRKRCSPISPHFVGSFLFLPPLSLQPPPPFTPLWCLSRWSGLSGTTGFHWTGCVKTLSIRYQKLNQTFWAIKTLNYRACQIFTHSY